MKKVLLISLMLAATVTTPAWSLAPAIPVMVLVDEADAVVIGTLSDLRETDEGDFEVGRGTITVEVAVLGVPSDRRAISLTWANEKGVSCPRTEPWRQRGKRAVWLLRSADEGFFTADHPGQLIPIEAKADLEALLSALRRGGGQNSAKVRLLVAALAS